MFADGISRFLAPPLIAPGVIVDVSYPSFTPRGWAGAPAKKYIPTASDSSIPWEHVHDGVQSPPAWENLEPRARVLFTVGLAPCLPLGPLKFSKNDFF